MNLGLLTESIKIPRKKFSAILLLNSGTLAWFFLLLRYFPALSEAITLNPSWSNIGPAILFGSAIFWSIVGSFIGGKVNRRNLLIFSIALGLFSTILVALFQETVSVTISGFLMGMSFGLGLPSSMALIADCTVVEERARVSGTIVLLTFVLAFAAMVALRMLNLEQNVLGIVLLLALFRSAGFLACAIDKCQGQEQTATEKTHLSSSAYRQLALYLLPWVMFAIISSLAWNLIPVDEFAEEVATGTMYRYVFIAVFSLVSGAIADRYGRKQPIFIGLVVLGISFALLGFFGITETNVIIYLALSGVAWGSFFVLFLAVPGDLSGVGSREKFYGLGYILPIAVMLGFSLIPGESILVGQSASLVAQIFSAVLFLSIIPILRAKETLPETKRRDRELGEHLKKVGKIIQETKEDT